MKTFQDFLTEKEQIKEGSDALFKDVNGDYVFPYDEVWVADSSGKFTMNPRTRGARGDVMEMVKGSKDKAIVELVGMGEKPVPISRLKLRK